VYFVFGTGVRGSVRLRSGLAFSRSVLALEISQVKEAVTPREVVGCSNVLAETVTTTQEDGSGVHSPLPKKKIRGCVRLYPHLDGDPYNTILQKENTRRHHQNPSGNAKQRGARRFMR
jgi:hypothetical protein